MTRLAFALLLVTLAAPAACVKKSPTPPPAPAPSPVPAAAPRATMPTERPIPPPPPAVAMDPVVTPTADPFATAEIEKINQDSPLKPVFFAYDSDALDDAARATMAANAEVLKKYATWVITVEGHCDERGTAEYNLALGDRRALAARNYMVSLGIAADRLKTVSYGSEFPFAPGHDEEAWARNRRAHFMLTAK